MPSTKKSSAKISAVITNYNTKDTLLKCVHNLLDTGVFTDIIVVDNDSPDGSFDAAKEEFKNNSNVVLLKSENNGLSAGNNLGFSKAKGDIIVYLGTDAFPTRDALLEIFNYLSKHNGVGVVTPRLVLKDGRPDLDAHRGFPTPWASLCHWFYLDRLFPKSHLFNQYFMGWRDLKSVHEIDSCISHFMVVPRSTHDIVGMWDEDFFLYGEDIDFCFRVKKNGLKVIYYGPVEVLHYKGISVLRDTKSLKSQKKKLDPKYVRSLYKVRVASLEAMHLFYTKHMEALYPVPLNMLVFLGIFLLKQLRLSVFFIKYRKYLTNM